MIISFGKKIITSEISTITIDGVELHLHDLMDILDGLEDTSYGAVHISINSSKIENLLVNTQAAIRSARGSVARGPKYEEFVAMVTKARANNQANDPVNDEA